MSLLPLGSQQVLFQQRDFFGVHKVETDVAGDRHELIDGGVIHGIQLTNPALRDIPSSYYSASGPVGDFFASQAGGDGAWSVGVIGLGAGSIGCYARPGQSWTYFEIDPTVIDIARNPSLFTFLRDCTPDAKVDVGDARLTIARVPDKSYDLLVVDAFGGDAIPVHLLTREAIELYLTKLRPDGVLLFNISNKYVDIESVLAGVANALNLVAFVRTDVNVSPDEAAVGKTPSAWLVMSRDANNLASLPATPGWQQVEGSASSPVWTDDFSDLLTVMRLG